MRKRIRQQAADLADGRGRNCREADIQHQCDGPATAGDRRPPAVLPTVFKSVTCCHMMIMEAEVGRPAVIPRVPVPTGISRDACPCNLPSERK